MKRFRVVLLITGCLLSSPIRSAEGSPAVQTSWERSYDFRGGWDVGVSVCIDRDGNSYIADLSNSSLTSWGNTDVALLKYDPSGVLLWTARYDSLDGEYEGPTMVALDPLGDVWVSGTEGLGIKHLLLKYNSDGQLIFKRNVTGPRGGGDFRLRFEFDSLGNLYGSANRLTFKCDANGNLLWSDSTLGNTDPGIAVDAQGNCYSAKSTGIRAYTPAGAIRWTQYFSRRYTIVRLAPANDAVYVSGWSSTGEDLNYYLTKFDTSGTMLWERIYDRGPGNDPDEPEAMALDAAGNIYVTGTAGTLKYDPSGSLLWAVGPAYGYAENKVMAVDSAGFAYVSVVDNGMFTKCISPDGVVLWGRTFQTNYDGRPDAIACTNDGTIIVTGMGIGQSTYYDVTTVQYDRTDCPDADADMTCDVDDICVTIPNPLQRDYDHDLVGDECDRCNDTDRDGYGDPGFPSDTCPVDNCFFYNPDQADRDGDGEGDICDCCTDSDGDGWGDPDIVEPFHCWQWGCSHSDNCPQTPNADQADTNGNGIGDVCECECLCRADPICDSIQGTLTDVVKVVDVAFRGMTAPDDPGDNCGFESTDVDCSGTTSVVDVVLTVNVAFRDGNPATEFCSPCP